ncbi:MAG: tryptophanase [Candidatus Obscuribacterales bacterium]|jgi:tyrosine phenol-lyase|nr:tryptophanase [Candidatus Obscuribacterales bacterium]
MMKRKRAYIVEPYKIKVVEPLPIIDKTRRLAALEEAHYNTFLLRSEDVFIDLLTDSGTSAMSDYQWAGMMLGDEAYAGSRNFYKLEKTVQQFYGYEFVVPTHQGRGAEHILSQIMIRPGDFVPGNMYFTTTRAHQELAGATFRDVIIDEAHDSSSLHPFKGNVCPSKLQALIAEVGAERIPYLNMQACVNMAGGQPFSLENLRVVSRICRSNGIKVILDATRAMENAWFIKSREPGYKNKSCAEILKQICDLTDGCTMSGKKDLLVNIGGFLALRDCSLYEKACELVTLFEGLQTYGGMAGRDMEAMARGIEEAIVDRHLETRIKQVEYLGQQLLDQGVPLVQPFGGHAIYLDASAFLSHMPKEQFRGQSLAAFIYLESGIRTMERGAVSAGRDKVTKQNHYPKLELVRLTIPRRVYTQSHMDFVADSIVECFSLRKSIPGLSMTYETENLRFFTARFSPVDRFVSDRNADCLPPLEHSLGKRLAKPV